MPREETYTSAEPAANSGTSSNYNQLSHNIDNLLLGKVYGINKQLDVYSY